MSRVVESAIAECEDFRPSSKRVERYDSPRAAEVRAATAEDGNSP